jgi:hypothetical protein
MKYDYRMDRTNQIICVCIDGSGIKEYFSLYDWFRFWIADNVSKLFTVLSEGLHHNRKRAA